MYTTLLQPQKIIKKPFRVIGETPDISFVVNSFGDVRVILLDDEGLIKLLSNQSPIKYYDSEPKSYHYAKIRLPHGGMWYLIIYNPSGTAEASYACNIYTGY
jgi:hypothetical protein